MSNVTHPSHYNTGKIEVLEFLEDQQLGLHLGNAVKYICRAGRKDPKKTIEDLEKSAFYLNRKIHLLKAEAEGRAPLRPNEMNSRALGHKLPSGGKRVVHACENPANETCAWFAASGVSCDLHDQPCVEAHCEVHGPRCKLQGCES